MNTYINSLIINQNHGAGEFTRNLKNEWDYRILLEPVYESFKNGNKESMETLYRKLLEKSLLKKKAGEFIECAKRAPGMALVFGTAKHQDIITIGYQQEVNDDGNESFVELSPDSIFDLASVTKLFTCIIVLKMIEEGRLCLKDNIADLDKRFSYLSNVTIEDLLTFRVPIKTEGRIEFANTLEEAESLIFHVKPDMTQVRLYTDMGAIVLKYVLEKVTGIGLYQLVDTYILRPCEMKDTVIEIPSSRVSRIVSNNYERRLLNGEYIVIDTVKRGVVNDGKARKLMQWKKELYGHAGLFATCEDMTKFARGLMSGKLLSTEWLDKMGINNTGKRLPNGEFSQFHGYLCYSKNPVETNSEVSHWLSGNAFAMGGYTGTQLTVDCLNQVFVFMASNRCHNRVTNINGKQVTNDGVKYVDWNDGKKYICNKTYAYERDENVIRPAVELAMQYRFLEYLMDKEY